MRTFIYILCMQWALTAAGLSVAGRRLAPRAPVSLWAACLAPLFLLGGLATLTPFWPALTLPGRLLIGIMAGWSLLTWLGAIRGAWLRRLPTLDGREQARLLPWAESGLALGVMLVALSAWLLANWLRQQDPFTPLPASWLALSIGAGVLSGALLTASAGYGLLTGSSGEPALPPLVEPTRVYHAILWLELATLLRWVVIAGALRLGASFNPIGSHYFLRRAVLIGGPTLLARALLGLVLPVLFGWLAYLAMREGDRRQAARTFLPAMIVVVVGEILGATLTVGLSGVSF